MSTSSVAIRKPGKFPASAHGTPDRIAVKRFAALSLSLLLIAAFAAAALTGCGDNNPRDTYTQKLWDENRGTYQKIIDSPFNRGVADGTLDDRAFRNYVIQDYFYLRNFKHVYRTLLSKAPDAQGKKVISDILKGIDQEIDSVHEVYFRKYGVTARELKDSRPNPTTRAYNSYLLNAAEHEPFEVGLIATLPCHWIYFQVGVHMKKAKKVKGNKYRQWIDEYGSDTWEQSETRVFVDLVERYMKSADKETRRKMGQAFGKAFGFEYEFWDAVYKESQSGLSPEYAYHLFAVPPPRPRLQAGRLKLVRGYGNEETAARPPSRPTTHS